MQQIQFKLKNFNIYELSTPSAVPFIFVHDVTIYFYRKHVRFQNNICPFLQLTDHIKYHVIFRLKEEPISTQNPKVCAIIPAVTVHAVTLKQSNMRDIKKLQHGHLSQLTVCI